MNEYDSNRILDFTKKINYISTQNILEADCYVLNTCHIREKATDKVYHDIGRLKKNFKNKKKPITIIAGCVAQAEGELLLKKEKDIDAVIGPQSYHEINKIISIAENLEKKKEVNVTEFDTVSKFDHINKLKNNDNKVSSFLTIQEGCDKFCKFCVVPYTRGPEHSRPFSQIVSEAKQLVDNGAKEIILLGQNVNAYHFENEKLSDILFELNKIQNLERIRYTTSHPKDVSDDLINAHGELEKIMPLLHLPVQSGSNTVLKKKNRGHTINEYLQKIEKLKKVNPAIKFSSDFIIGYPSETEKDFMNTLDLMKKIEFINSYSFIFSPRPGTPAAKMTEVNKEVSKKRLTIFQNIADEIKKNYRNKLKNSISKVLFENKANSENRYFGRDEYFNSVIVESEENLVGKVKKIKIKDCNNNTLFGEIISKNKEKNYAA